MPPALRVIRERKESLFIRIGGFNGRNRSDLDLLRLVLFRFGLKCRQHAFVEIRRHLSARFIKKVKANPALSSTVEERPMNIPDSANIAPMCVQTCAIKNIVQ